MELLEQRARARLAGRGLGHRRGHARQEGGPVQERVHRGRRLVEHLDREVVEDRRRRRVAGFRQRQPLRERTREQHDAGRPAARELVERVEPAVRIDPVRRRERGRLRARQAQRRELDRRQVRARQPAREPRRRRLAARDDSEDAGRHRSEQRVGHRVHRRVRGERLVVVEDEDERRVDRGAQALEETPGEEADARALRLAERREVGDAERGAGAGREVKEERRRIGVAGVEREPETGQAPRLDPARDERRLPGPAGCRDPDRLAPARLVERREQALAPQDLPGGRPDELRDRPRPLLHLVVGLPLERRSAGAARPVGSRAIRRFPSSRDGPDAVDARPSG